MECITEEVLKEISGMECEFTNIELYNQAFTHKSYSKEHNERLEFIGDSILNFVIAEYLFNKYNKEDEGFLTRIRTKLVNGENLNKVAISKKFNLYVKMNERALRKGWNNNSRILEDVCESYIGALYQDKGFEICKKWITTNIINNSFKNMNELHKDTNYKDQLMKIAQQNNFQIEYKVYKEEGPEHEKTFTIQVKMDKLLLSTGQGNTKKRAEQEGAKKAIECLR